MAIQNSNPSHLWLMHRIGTAAAVVAVTAAADSNIYSSRATIWQQGPKFGREWSGSVESNMTQIGFDMGMVLVNFTGQCNTPRTQKAQTVYGDFYTLLLLCDQGVEYEIAPASRGGGCKKRVVGADLDPRVCEVCSCPFCIRDTNGTYPNTTWDVIHSQRKVDGVDAYVWTGHQSSGQDDSHRVSVAFVANRNTGELEPFATNISDQLWVTSRAKILDYQPTADGSKFIIPDKCLHTTQDTIQHHPVETVSSGGSMHTDWSQHALFPARRLPETSARQNQVSHRIYADEDPLERAALLELAEATNLSGWVRNKNWGSGPICDWELVGCDASGRVKLLTLDFNNLVGTLPLSLGNALTHLQDLDLEGNDLTGSIPETIGSLKNSLVQLGLGNNAFTGSVPASLCGLDATHAAACDLSGSNFTCPLPCNSIRRCGATCHN